jgi:magnesium transporter
MVLKTVSYVGHAQPTTANEIVETGELMVFVGPDFVITVRHGEHSSLTEVRRRLEADPEQLALGPAAVLHAVADRVVDTYLDVTEAIEDDIDEMEREVFTPRSKMDAEQIYVMKREILELRRAVAPLAGPLRKLTEGYSSLVPHEVRSYFRDVDDHLSTVTERVGGFNELLSSLVDAVLAKTTMQQNNDMRRITSYAALLTVPTMVAGIYGMNFDFMPELHWAYGYPMMLLGTALLCFVLFRMFRRNRWL